jgi:tetratricopeptide (TPR) repeat protein
MRYFINFLWLVLSCEQWFTQSLWVRPSRTRPVKSYGLRPSHNRFVSAHQAPEQATDPVHQLISGEMAWNTLIGQADRAFRLGIQLEKNGQPRKASASFHEAATLYQCYLDSESEFGHVTSLSQEDSQAILAYACMRLAFLNLDALGDPKAAARLYKEASAIDPFPSAESFDGIGQALEAAFGGQHLEDAIEQYRKALELAPERQESQFHVAVASDRLQQSDQSEEIFERLRRDESKCSCLVDSWGYVRWHTRKIPNDSLYLYRGTRDIMEVALNAALPLIEQGGLVCEFGVGSGRSLRMAQDILPLDARIHGFDTFTGLPQAWGTEPIGTYSTGGVAPNMEGKVTFHRGLFRDTIGPFLKEQEESTFLAYANVDCQLYSSTLDILEGFHGYIVPGTILIFDEYICHPSWRYDEFRAWRECCKRFGWKYEYLAFSLSTKQAVVRLTTA